MQQVDLARIDLRVFSVSPYFHLSKEVAQQPCKCHQQLKIGITLCKDAGIPVGFDYPAGGTGTRVLAEAEEQRTNKGNSTKHATEAGEDDDEDWEPVK